MYGCEEPAVIHVKGSRLPGSHATERAAGDALDFPEVAHTRPTREPQPRPPVESRRTAESHARLRRRVGRAPDPPYLGLQLLLPGLHPWGIVPFGDLD